MNEISTTAGSDHSSEIIIPTAGSLTVGHKELEIIGGFKVHPMASKFPPIEGEEFEKFVDAIAPLALRPRDAAAALGVSERLLLEWRKNHGLPYVRLGETVLHPVPDHHPHISTEDSSL